MWHRLGFLREMDNAPYRVVSPFPHMSWQQGGVAMHRFRTVRFSYLYIFAGSALMSIALLFVIQQVIALLYSHYSGHSGGLFIRLIHWVINHIGATPCAIILFTTVFCGLYILRSQKIADDLQMLRTATAELAAKGITREIKVLSGGELCEMATNLNRVHRVEVPGRDGELNRDDTKAVALLLRTRAILRVLREVEEAGSKVESEIQILLTTVNSEARSMERFLENLIIES